MPARPASDWSVVRIYLLEALEAPLVLEGLEDKKVGGEQHRVQAEQRQAGVGAQLAAVLDVCQLLIGRSRTETGPVNKTKTVARTGRTKEFLRRIRIIIKR
eukprot:1060414-Pyramimonas_sp.AAC.1